MKKLVDFYIGSLDCKAFVLNWDMVFIDEEFKSFQAILKKENNLLVIIDRRAPVYVATDEKLIIGVLVLRNFVIGKNEIRIGYPKVRL